MDILNKIFSLSGMTVVIFGAFLIAAVGYALGRITIKGVSRYCWSFSGGVVVWLPFHINGTY